MRAFPRAIAHQIQVLIRGCKPDATVLHDIGWLKIISCAGQTSRLMIDWEDLGIVCGKQVAE
jgi:hypothetical protein